MGSRVPAVDETRNILDHQVLGNKGDTAVDQPTTTASLMAMIKGLATRSAPFLAATGIKANTPTGNFTLFTVTGAIKIVDIVGIVATTAFAAATALCKVAVTCDALTEVDLCAAVEMNAAAVGTTYHITGTVANAAVLGVNGVTISQAGALIIVPTTSAVIALNNAGAANAGQMKWYLVYQPLKAGTTVAAAF